MPADFPSHQIAGISMPSIHIQTWLDKDEELGAAYVEILKCGCRRWYVLALLYPRGFIGRYHMGHFMGFET